MYFVTIPLHSIEKCNNRRMSETKSPRHALRIAAAAAVGALALGVPSLLGDLAPTSDPSSVPDAAALDRAAGERVVLPTVPVVLTQPPSTTTTTTTPPPPPPTSGETAIRSAFSTLGTPYRYGGSTPGGFDCSGLVMWSFAQAGVQVPRTASEQRRASTSISEADLRIGDLVFYYGTGHVGMYIGNGHIIHSPRTGKSVEVVPVHRGGMTPSSFGRIDRIK